MTDDVTECILSYGGGVNSTALLLEWLRRGNELDALIFADPGSEMPETYEFIERSIKPFCKERNIPFETVRLRAGNRNPNWDEGEVIPIYEGYARNRGVPAIRMRTCSIKWKGSLIDKMIAEKYKGAHHLIGIDYSEKHRAKIFIDPETGKEEYVYPDKSYPLVDWEWTRDDCIQAIEEYGWEVPVKSGCYFCPFQSRDSWKALYENHPALYIKAELLESNNNSFPDYGLMQSNPKRLDWYRKAMETQTTLDSYTDSEEAANIPCMCYDG